jgi:methionyl-tRNA formyltransferase
MGEETLRLCVRRGDHVVAVLTPGDDDRLASAARAAGVPTTVCPVRVTDAAIPPATDIILSVHNAHAFIDAGARAAARLGALGYHPSLLPRHRGRDAMR